MAKKKCSSHSGPAPSSSSKSGKVAWNKGKPFNVSGSQHVFVKREDVEIFLAALLYVAGPVYTVIIWLGMVTSRRISELLRLRGLDFVLEGGGECDAPHIVVKEREEDFGVPGMGKLHGKVEIARLSEHVVASLSHLIGNGMAWECKPVLEQFKVQHKVHFDCVVPLSSANFHPEPLCKDALWFPASSGKCKWRSRQSVWHAIKKTRIFLFAITGKRCFNPDKKFNGAHVHVHGATRHTAAALLMGNPNSNEKRPSEEVILEVQQRTCYRTFRKHYCHVPDDAISSALKFADVDSPFKAPASGSTQGLSSSDVLDPTPPVQSVSTASAGNKALAKAEPILKVHSKPSRNSWRKAKRREGLAKHNKTARQ